MKKKDALLSILSGALLIFSFPNFDFEFLAWIALIPLFYAIEGKTLFQSFRIGCWTGLTAFLGILYWIIVAVHTYGNIPMVLSIPILLLLVAYLSLYTGIFALLTRFFQNRMGSQSIFLTPFLWVALEYLRSFLITGFPWASLAYSQSLNLPFIQIADITGPYGLSFVIVLVNVLIFQILFRRPKGTFPVRETVLTAVLILAVGVYGYLKMEKTDREMAQNPSLKIGLIQGNIDQSVKWSEAFQKETLTIYERLTLKAAEEKPELILWPETAVPFLFQDAREYRSSVTNLPVRTNVYLLFGTPTYQITGRRVDYYNSAYLLAPSGEPVGAYDKIHLVPFGEYVPLRRLLSFIGSLGEGIGDFKSGKEKTLFSLPQGKFGVVICFEVIFPDLCRKFVKEGATFLVTITNDAWFGRTSAPYQHLSMATFRAVENRVFVARAANTGITALIDANGRILKQGGIFTEEAINGVLRLSNHKTFYTLYGDWFAGISSGLSMLLLIYVIFKKPQKPRKPRKKK